MAFSEFPNSAREHCPRLDVSSIRVAGPSRLHKAHLTSARRPFRMDMSDSSALAIASLYLVATAHLFNSSSESVHCQLTLPCSVGCPNCASCADLDMACIASKDISNDAYDISLPLGPSSWQASRRLREVTGHNGLSRSHGWLKAT